MTESDRRLHPLSWLFILLAQAKSFVLPLIALLFTTRQLAWTWETWALVGLVPAAFVALVQYFRLRYRYEAHELVLRTGFLTRIERHIPYDRIQNIDASQNVIHRLFDAVEVRLETAGGTEPEAILRVLHAKDLEEMRRRVFAGRSDDVRRDETGAAAAGRQEAARVVLSLTPRDLLIHGLIENRGMIVVGAALGLAWELWFADRAYGVSLAQPWIALFRGNPEAVWARLPSAWVIAVAIAGFLILVRLLSMGWSLLRYHGFELRRTGDDLRATYGLLTRVSATVPRHRIQALTVEEKPLHRWFGRVSVRAETAGGSGGSESRVERAWIAPLLRREDVASFVAQVQPGVEWSAVAWQVVHPKATGRLFRKALALQTLVLLVLAAPTGGWSLAALPIAVAGAAIYGPRAARALGWATTPTALFARHGWWVRRVRLVPFGKIQVTSLLSTPFDRRAGMASVWTDHAGARGGARGVGIGYIDAQLATRLHAELAAAAGASRFAW